VFASDAIIWRIVCLCVKAAWHDDVTYDAWSQLCWILPWAIRSESFYLLIANNDVC